MAAAEGGCMVRREEVHSDRAGVDTPRDLEGAILVSAEHDPAEPEGCRVGDRDRIIDVARGKD